MEKGWRQAARCTPSNLWPWGQVIPQFLKVIYCMCRFCAPRMLCCTAHRWSSLVSCVLLRATACETMGYSAQRDAFSPVPHYWRHRGSTELDVHVYGLWEETHKQTSHCTCKRHLIWAQTLKFVASTAPPGNWVFNQSEKKNTDHFRCFDEKQSAFWCQRFRVTILPSQLQTDGWYSIHVSSLLINDNDKFVLLSSPCCVHQTHNDSLSSFIINYSSFNSHLHNKDHL